ncbi:metallophosphoesterase [Castellaniella sp.]|uniref:metallophosphoesterase n=1 Tax=Castellaniella sp. TaxID=1955812 RepID=UPI0035667B57
MSVHVGRSGLRLHILSDLHLSMQNLALPDVSADVTILAGDVARPEAAMQWASQIPRPVLYVPGNHEFYGGSIPGVRADLSRAAQAHGIRLLDQQAVVIEGVRFLGATLWTDFKLYGAELQDSVMQKAAEFMRDFKVIRNADGSVFSPRDAAALFAEQYAWLDAQLDLPHDGPTVVITHHAPSMRSVHPRFAESLLSAGFVSDCSGLLGRADLWVHGHTHDSFDYHALGTRVLCNPRGYCVKGVDENAQFDAGLCIELPPPGGA